MPLPSFRNPPAARRDPSALRTADHLPNKSPAASPSISAPTCTQALPFQSNTRTWPALVPLASFLEAPTARRDPSPFSDTKVPNSSPAASPSMSWPSCTQAPLPAFHSNTRAWPELDPLPSL